MEVVSGYVVPSNDYSARLSASLVVPGHLLVYGFTVYSSNAAAQWATIFDAQTLPADASVPVFALDLPSKQLRGVSYTPNGREFLQGFAISNSSTDTAKTIGTADCFFDVQFVNLDLHHYGEQSGS